MPITITVPRLGWSMDEGTFVGWLKKDGDTVKAGEPLFTLEGDKASQEIEATDSGILRIPPDAPKTGGTVSVGTVLGYLVGENERSWPSEAAPRLGTISAEPAADASPKEAAAAPAAVPAQAQAEAGGPASAVAISPRARRRALELGVDYSR